MVGSVLELEASHIVPELERSGVPVVEGIPFEGPDKNNLIRMRISLESRAHHQLSWCFRAHH